MLALGFLSGWVFWTACRSISRSCSLVLGGSRVFCHVAIGRYVGIAGHELKAASDPSPICSKLWMFFSNRRIELFFKLRSRERKEASDNGRDHHHPYLVLVALEKRWRFVAPPHVKNRMPAQVYVGDPGYPNKNDQRRYYKNRKLSDFRVPYKRHCKGKEGDWGKPTTVKCSRLSLASFEYLLDRKK